MLEKSLDSHSRALLEAIMASCSPTIDQAQLPYERVRTFEIESGDGYDYWCRMMWHNFAGATSQEDGEAEQPHTAQECQTWLNWATADGRLDFLLELIASGLANQHGENRMRANAWRRACLESL